jgi:hypothetical protein
MNIYNMMEDILIRILDIPRLYQKYQIVYQNNIEYIKYLPHQFKIR